MNRYPLVLLLTVVLLASCGGSPRVANDEPVDAWEPLFGENLSAADFSPEAWTMQDGVLTAHEDEEIWSHETYDDFILELEFMTEDGSNSGVIIHADTTDWVPNSLEIQIADDYHETWANAPETWQAGAIFGHLAPSSSEVKVPGEWNHMRIVSEGRTIRVQLNGVWVAEMDMDQWTSADVNPDGSEIPDWLSRPVADLAARGQIGLQGAHGEASISFRNMRIRRLTP